MLLIILLLSTSFSIFGIDCSIIQSWFKREILCDLDERLSTGCSKKRTTFSVSLVKCASFCSQDATSCRGASVDENGHCFLHWNCPNVETSCTVTNPNHNYRKAVCVPGIGSGSVSFCEVEVSSTESPTTESPTTEVPTTQRPTSCHDLGDLYSGYNRVYIDPYGDGRNHFHVLCDGSYSLIFMRNRGNINFNRTWTEYQQGFYIDNYNLWGGLDLWVASSNAGYKSVFVITFENGDSLSTEYRHITFTDAADGYKISFGSITSRMPDSLIGQNVTLGDCLGIVQNMRFSTWDRDNTKQGLGCAKTAGSGWWYFDDSCVNTCNMLGWEKDNWISRPSHKRFSVPGLNMADWYTHVKMLEIYIKS